MAGPVLLASTIMNSSAALLNDVALTVYTYVAQMPYLNMAMLELKELFELNEVPVVQTTSVAINCPAGTSSIGFAPDPAIPNTPYLPDDLIEPQVLWERPEGQDPYTPMHKVNILPQQLAGTEISQFQIYTWETQQIKVFPANADIDIKMDYIRDLFTTVTDPDDEIFVLNAQSFLQYRNAALCAKFIGENPTRATDLNGFAGLSMDRAVGIGTKGRQGMVVRRRPFRQGYKRRNVS